MEALRQRLLSQIEKVPSPLETDCWLFTGARTTTGCGQFHYKGIHYLAHRISYQLYKGPIPNGLFVLHICDCQPCCNPDHLWLGDQGDNMAEMRAKRYEQREAELEKAKNVLAAMMRLAPQRQKFIRRI